MCVACRARRAQHEFVRVALTPDGVRAGTAAQSPGRGAYVCPDPDCVERAVRRGGQALRRALRADASDVGDVAAVLTAAVQALQAAPRQMPAEQVQLEQQAKERSR